MEGFEVTKLGERGQVVIPLEFRKSMGLRGGDKFIVLGQGDTLLLRKLRAPTMEEFEEMLKEGQAFAKKHHLAEKDVEDAIKKHGQQNMRAVLDTNIFISGIHWAGSPREVLWAWYSGKFELVTSPAILDELSETLSTFRIIISQERLERWRNAITGKSIIVTPTNLIRAVQDPDDNKFIEAAVEGNADFIVSKDKHLLELKKYDKIEILTPEEFLEKIC